ncbi:MAG TPA: phosphotransferase [Mycobacteriales bacterium]|jgi:aminoglycoside phosphotransferase|nr:phosphotransferase [Mycobacteriales bacterium]
MLTAAGTIGVRHGFAPDPALPARDLLLDQDAARDQLTALDGRVVEDCELVRVKYRIGESLRVTYRVGVDGTCGLRTVRVFRGGDSASAYRKAAGPGVVHDPALDAVWWSFPADRRLQRLDEILRPAPDLAALASGWATSELVEYSPERAATFRALDRAGTPVGYAKAYAPGTVDVGERADRYGRIAGVLAGAGLSSPLPLGRSPERGVLVMQPMPGVQWGELDGPALTAAIRRLGVAIATLHDSGDRAAAGLPRFARLDVRRVVHSAHLVALARPDVSRQALRLADRLADGPPPGGSPVPLHGDCHPKNALVDGDAIALIDLDQAGTGPAAADIGSLIARLHQDGDTGAMRAAFLAGYRTVRALPAERSLRWHTAAALVAERAVRAVNRVHLPTLDRLGDLLRTADDVLLNGVGL